MVKQASNVVLDSPQSSTYPEGTLPVVTRLRPSWKASLTIRKEKTWTGAISILAGTISVSVLSRGYASGFDSPAALLDDRFDKPAYDGERADSMRSSASNKSACRNR